MLCTLLRGNRADPLSTSCASITPNAETEAFRSLRPSLEEASVQSLREKRFDHNFVLQNLYGNGFDPKCGQKDKQIAILGLHNSGANSAVWHFQLPHQPNQQLRPERCNMLTWKLNR